MGVPQPYQVAIHSCLFILGISWSSIAPQPPPWNQSGKQNWTSLWAVYFDWMPPRPGSIWNLEVLHEALLQFYNIIHGSPCRGTDGHHHPTLLQPRNRNLCGGSLDVWFFGHVILFCNVWYGPCINQNIIVFSWWLNLKFRVLLEMPQTRVQEPQTSPKDNLWPLWSLYKNALATSSMRLRLCFSIYSNPTMCPEIRCDRALCGESLGE